MALTERSLPRLRGWSRPVRAGLGEIIPVKEPGLDNRHRDKNGEISKKHGNTVISTLRQTYGQGFAPGQPGHKKLSEILHELDIESLSQLVKGLPPPPYV
jgi:hypothetical protein